MRQQSLVSKYSICKLLNLMAVALFVTAVISYELVNNYLTFISSSLGLGLGIVLLISQIVGSIFLSNSLNRLSDIVLSMMLVCYVIITGITSSIIFNYFEIVPAYIIFFAVSIMFVITSIYARCMRDDYVIKTFKLAMLLFGFFVLWAINRFLGGSSFDLVFSFLGIVLFVFLAAYTIETALREQAVSKNQSEMTFALKIVLLLYVNLFKLFLFAPYLMGGRDKGINSFIRQGQAPDKL